MRRPLGLILFAALLLPACGLLSLHPQAIPSRPAAPTSEITLVLNDPRGGFSIEVPAAWSRLDEGTYPIVFSTQAASGTNLLEKRMEIDVRETTANCRQSTYGGGQSDVSTERVLINNADFLFESGAGIALGNIYEWTSYSTSKGWTCITVTFVLHAAGSGVYATEPPPFDRSAESKIFDQLIKSFRFE
jgi:hypothetical protein